MSYGRSLGHGVGALTFGYLEWVIVRVSSTQESNIPYKMNEPTVKINTTDTLLASLDNALSVSHLPGSPTYSVVDNLTLNRANLVFSVGYCRNKWQCVTSEAWSQRMLWLPSCSFRSLIQKKLATKLPFKKYTWQELRPPANNLCLLACHVGKPLWKVSAPSLTPKTSERKSAKPFPTFLSLGTVKNTVYCSCKPLNFGIIYVAISNW